ncbi:hypothetical protein [Paenibacillus sp. GCM10027626]|uniref:hypothetical protein n=1 Tax=Paenibacillus sp. GCM10027626 TaxID=3273411 RepID=UPI0036431F27
MKNMELAAPADIRNRLLALAALDIILCPEEQYRYYSFEPHWSPGVELFKIDNGSGDHMFIVLAAEGVIIKGFDHESALSPYANDDETVWTGIYDQVPAKLMSLLADEAIEQNVVTFCLWCEAGQAGWRKGDVLIPSGEDDGSAFLLGAIISTADEYEEWASHYYEMPIDRAAVEKVFAEGPLSLTAELIHALNPDRDMAEVRKELQALGW